MKQKANRYSSYFTPKILIAVAIFLIIVNKPLFIVNDPTSSLLVMILLIPYFILNFLIPSFINIEYILTNVLVTTGTIGSIIIIAIGYIYLSFPIVDYNARHFNMPINTREISRARFGSKLIMLSGFGLFIHFFIKYIQLYEFSLFTHLIKFENLYLNILLLLCAIGAFLQKYDVSSYPPLYMTENKYKKDKYDMDEKYTDDIDKIKNLKILNNSIIDWGPRVKYVDSDDELEWEFLHIRNNVESFIHVLICAFLISGMLGMLLLGYIPIMSVFFSCGFFLVIICPNAIDTMRIKNSRLFTRVCGVVGMFSFGMSSLSICPYMWFMAFGIIIGLIPSICLYGIYSRFKKLPFGINIT